MVDVFPVRQLVPDRERLVGCSDPHCRYVQYRSSRSTFHQILTVNSKPHRKMVPMGRGLRPRLRRTLPASSSQRSRIQRGPKARGVLQPPVLDRSHQNLFNVHYHDRHNKYNEANHFCCSVGGSGTVFPNNIRPGSNRTTQRSGTRYARAVISTRRSLASRNRNNQQGQRQQPHCSGRRSRDRSRSLFRACWDICALASVPPQKRNPK
jgi:hypothetical protein